MEASNHSGVEVAALLPEGARVMTFDEHLKARFKSLAASNARAEFMVESFTRPDVVSLGQAIAERPLRIVYQERRG